MSMFIKGLFLSGSFTLDLVIRVNKLFLDFDVTKLSESWYDYRNRKAKIEINKIN